MKSLELIIERIILSSRWILVVFYFGLVAALAVYAFSFALKFLKIAQNVFVYTDADRDGALEGPSLDDVRSIAGAVRGRFLYAGGIGTLDELFEAWSWNALGYHAKPFCLLNVGGFWDGLIDFMDHAPPGDRRRYLAPAGRRGGPVPGPAVPGRRLTIIV